MATIQSVSSEKTSVDPWYIGMREAAERSDLAQTTIWNALQSGELRGFRVGRRWLIAVEDLHAWIRGESNDHAA